MSAKRTRMFSAERAGLLAVAVLILFIAALAMCSRTSCSPQPAQPMPDSTLAAQIDSAAKAPADSAKKAPRRPRKQIRKKSLNPDNSRRHLDETVETKQIEQ